MLYQASVSNMLSMRSPQSKKNRLNALLYKTPNEIKEQFQWDDEALWSLTHQKIGVMICSTLLNLGVKQDAVIVDAMSSVGGNTIPFAMTFATVYAFEKDPIRKTMLDNNLKLYGIENVHTLCDFCQNHNIPCDVIFYDPPWGKYYKNFPPGQLRLCVSSPYGSQTLEELVIAGGAKYIVMKLPHNYDFAHFVTELKKVGEIVELFQYGRPNSCVILIVRIAAL